MIKTSVFALFALISTTAKGGQFEVWALESNIVEVAPDAVVGRIGPQEEERLGLVFYSPDVRILTVEFDGSILEASSEEVNLGRFLGESKTFGLFEQSTKRWFYMAVEIMGSGIRIGRLREICPNCLILEVSPVMMDKEKLPEIDWKKIIDQHLSFTD